jgi:hypothetical protein
LGAEAPQIIPEEGVAAAAAVSLTLLVRDPATLGVGAIADGVSLAPGGGLLVVAGA